MFHFLVIEAYQIYHFKNDLIIYKKLGFYKRFKVSKSNKNNEIDANRTEMLCAKFMSKKSLFNKLKNILRNKTYDKLVKIDQELSLI